MFPKLHMHSTLASSTHNHKITKINWFLLYNIAVSLHGTILLFNDQHTIMVVFSHPSYDKDATDCLSVSFNSDKPHAEIKPLTWDFQICIGWYYSIHA